MHSVTQRNCMKSIKISNEESIVAYAAIRRHLEIVEDSVEDIKKFPEDFPEGALEASEAEVAAMHSMLDKLVGR